MDQQTSEWHEWRNRSIGSSDAPVIMGVSKWKSLHQLWLEKTGRAKAKDNTFIMNRGNTLEPIARARYELLEGLDMRPGCYQHRDLEYMTASMDGANQELQGGLEIKYCGKDDFALVKTGVVPEKYYPQVQHQLFVTGFKWIDYFSYYLKPEFLKDADFYHRGESHCIRVYADIDYIRAYVTKAIEFRKMIEKNIEPSLPVKKTRNKKDAQT